MLKRNKSLLLAVALFFSLIVSSNAAFAETASSAGSTNNSLYFDTRTNNLQMSPGVNIGTQPFTFETYFKTGPKIDYGFFLGVANGNGMSINIHSANEIQIDAYGINATVFILSSALQVNTWHHIAVARDANNDETVWVDGVRATSSKNRWDNTPYGAVYRDTRNYGGQATGLNISTGCGHCNDGLGDAATNDFAQVRITNYRIVVGSTVYDPNLATITLPTTPLANVTNTKVLLNVTDSSSFLTDSSGNQTITNSSVTFRSADITAPSAPTSLSATAGDGQAVISFTAGATGGSAITNYKYSLDGSTFTTLSPPQTISPITVSGLTNGTTYDIYLKAVNTVGDSVSSSLVSVTPVATNTGGGGGSSSSVSVITTPIVTATTSGKDKIITWDQPEDLILNTYNRTTKKTKTSILVGGQVKLSNPKPGQSATYTITSASGEILKTFTIKSKPEAPKKVEVLIQATTLNASWKKAAGAKKYRVTITPDVGKPIVLTTTDPNISFDLENSAKATIKVVAIGANGLTSKAIKKSI